MRRWSGSRRRPRTVVGNGADGGGDLCRIQVDPSGFPVDAHVVHDKNGQYVKQTQFFVRVANGTKALDDAEKQKYLAHRWPGGA